METKTWEDKNAEALKKMESEEKNNSKIEVISETKNNNENSNEDNNVEKNSDKSINENRDQEKNNLDNNLNNQNKSELDQKILDTSDEIQKISEQKKQEKEIQKKAEELAKKMIEEQNIQNQKKQIWLSESEFSVSWAESELYNLSVRKKKEDELKLKYEKQLAEQAKEKKDLADKLEMIENKLKNLQKKTPEQIAEEKKQVSVREQRKKDEEVKQKKIAEEKAKQDEILKIERDKTNVAIEKFNHDTDWDWLSDHIEKNIETNNKLIDTDWDWYSDKREIEKFFNSNWDWKLFSDIWERDRRKDIIIAWTLRWLVFLRAWDKFLPDEEIYRDEAIKIIVSAMYPSEIYREDDFFKWVELYSDTSRDDDYARYLAIAIKHWILNWIIWDNFNPYSTFTRAQFITILEKATWKWVSNKKLKWIDTEPDNWFTAYFSKAKEIWIIKVDTINRIFPLNKISRYDAIKFALRASKYSN